VISREKVVEKKERSKMSESESAVNGNGNHCLTHLKYKALDMPSSLQADFVYPDLPSKCTWVVEKDKQPETPHTIRPL
jgi:hypothetical protein